MQATQTSSFATETERRRVEALVETLTRTRNRGGTLAEIAHDARNMVTAMALYCDLLEEPGVLSPGCLHYASELRLVTAASRRLVERLALLDGADAAERRTAVPETLEGGEAKFAGRPRSKFHAARMPNDPIENLEQELLANRNLLDALAGLAIGVTVRAEGGARPVRMSSEDLTRVLVNLVKNAAEAMRHAGQIEISLREFPPAEDSASCLVLAIEDTGPGIAEERLDTVFEPGYTTNTHGGEGGWPSAHRGLGLSITRSIVEAAGGRIRAENRSDSDTGGARIVIELPIRTR